MGGKRRTYSLDREKRVAGRKKHSKIKRLWKGPW